MQQTSSILATTLILIIVEPNTTLLTTGHIIPTLPINLTLALTPTATIVLTTSIVSIQMAHKAPNTAATNRQTTDLITQMLRTNSIRL